MHRHCVWVKTLPSSRARCPPRWIRSSSWRRSSWPPRGAPSRTWATSSGARSLAGGSEIPQPSRSAARSGFELPPLPSSSWPRPRLRPRRRARVDALCAPRRHSWRWSQKSPVSFSPAHHGRSSARAALTHATSDARSALGVARTARRSSTPTPPRIRKWHASMPATPARLHQDLRPARLRCP